MKPSKILSEAIKKIHAKYCSLLLTGDNEQSTELFLIIEQLREERGKLYELDL